MQISSETPGLVMHEYLLQAETLLMRDLYVYTHI